MKSRLVKILGVVVTLATLTALAAGLAAVPASAAPTALAWSTQGTPNPTNNVLVAGVKASAFAVSPDGMTVFAWDATATKMYVSTDGGVTFAVANGGVAIAGAVAAGATRTAFMAISPKYATDKTAVLVQTDTAAFGNNHVWWTTNGGTSWVDVANASLLANVPTNGDVISSVDLGYYWQTNVLNIVIGINGAVLAAGSNVLMFASGSFAWTPFGALTKQVVGVKFSPNHQSDAEVMAVFKGTAGLPSVDTYLTSSIGGLNFDITAGAVSYPAVLVASTTAGLTSVQIATATDYLANTGAPILVGTAGLTAGDGIWRVAGRTAGAGGSSTNVLAQAGAHPIIGLKVVGPLATATAYYTYGLQATSQVYRSTTFNTATVTWTGASKAPTGAAAAATNTLLGTGGTSIFAMTSGTATTDTALSVSTDGGANFQQTALIDVGTITNMSLVNVEVVDANTMFLIMANSSAGWLRTHVYKTTNGGTSWMRIFSSTSTSMTLISASPAYATDATVVVADTATTIVQKSVDGGNSFIPYGVLAAPSALLTTTGGNFYTGAANVLYKSGAFVGATGITGTVDSIAVSPKDTTGATIAVGTTGDTVWQSTNGGTSFTQVGTAAISAGANALVAYGPDGALYAGDNAGVYKWTTAWSATIAPAATVALGLVVSKDNTLYVADNTASTATAHGVDRSLDPTDTTPVFKSLSYASGFSVGERLSDIAVVSGTGADNIYVIDSSAVIATNTYTGALQAFSDTLIAVPAITAPKTGAVLTDTTSTTLSWPAVAGATDYEVTFDGTAYSGITTNSIVTSAAPMSLSLTPGSTHTWSVRVDSVTTPVVVGNTYSDSSATQTFTLALAAPAPVQTSSYPTAGQTDVDVNPSFSWPVVAGATSYDFVIAEELGNADKFAIIDYGDNTPINAYKLKEDLKYNTQYWWRVRAVSGTTTSAWVVSFFTTEAMPVTTTATTSTAPITVNPVTPTVTVTNVMPTQPVVTPTVINQGSTQQVIPTYLLWLVIVVGAVLVIAVIVLIVRTRRIS
jgi:hypothetical protein